jgi:hypothetical protein
MAARIQHRLVRSDGVSWTITEGDHLSLGRSQQNVVQIADSGASRRHATLIVARGRCWVRDENSTHGTFVNEQRVAGQQELRPGDRLRIGSEVFSLEQVQPAGQAKVQGTPLPQTRRRQVMWGMVSAVIIIVVIGIALVAGGDIAVVQSDFRVKCEDEVVWAGAGDADPVPKLSDDDWHDLPAGGLVKTDDDGQGIVQIKIDDRECLKIYIFQRSRLQKAACPKSDYTGGNVTCALEGTSVFNNLCASKVVIQTPSADLELEGTWVAVSYLPERQLTLVTVLEGQVIVLPVLDFESRGLGQPISVAEQEFLYTAPDAALEQVGDVPTRTSVSVDELGPVVEILDIEAWMERVREKARDDDVPFAPGPPTPTLAPASTPISAIMSDALLVQHLDSGATVDVAGIVADPDYNAVNELGFAVWENPLGDISGAGVLPALNVKIRYAISSEGDLYVGSVGTPSEALAVLIGYNEWWAKTLSLRDILLYRLLRLEYDQLVDSGYISGGDGLSGSVDIWNRYDETIHIMYSALMMFASYNGEWQWADRLDVWDPSGSGETTYTGNTRRTFDLSCSGNTYSFIYNHVYNDNSNSTYVNHDGATVASRGTTIGADDDIRLDDCPASIEIGGNRTWSELDAWVHVVVVGGVISSSNHAEYPASGGNPAPLELTIPPGP